MMNQQNTVPQIDWSRADLLIELALHVDCRNRSGVGISRSLFEQTGQGGLFEGHID